jgi:hypothetical protein
MNNTQWDNFPSRFGVNKIMIRSNPRKKEAVIKKTPPPAIC